MSLRFPCLKPMETILTLAQVEERLRGYQPPHIDGNFKRRAAVAMLLRDNDGTTEVLLIKRAEQDQDPWSGDLGFPGGGIEETDASPQAAAERETREEMGVELDATNYLGQSDSLAGAYLSVHVSCFVYHVDEDIEFKPNVEVVDFFWIPFTTLLEPQRNQYHTFYYRGCDRNHPVVLLDEWSNRPLWGITYRLIDSFLRLFGLSFTHRDKC